MEQYRSANSIPLHDLASFAHQHVTQITQKSARMLDKAFERCIIVRSFVRSRNLCTKLKIRKQPTNRGECGNLSRFTRKNKQRHPCRYEDCISWVQFTTRVCSANSETDGFCCHPWQTVPHCLSVQSEAACSQCGKERGFENRTSVYGRSESGQNARTFPFSK